MNTQTEPMKMSDLRMNLLVQTPRNEVLKISTVYPPHGNGTGYVTATVVYPLQPRTTVRSYMPDEVATWREPTPQILAKYEIAWGYR